MENNKKVSKNYCLLVRDHKNKKNYKIEIPSYNDRVKSYNSRLSDIDTFTLQFPSKEEMLVNVLGHLKKDFYFLDVIIEHYIGNDVEILSPIYMSDENNILLQSFALENGADYNDKSHINFIQSILIKLEKNYSFYNYLTSPKNKTINPYLKFRVKELLDAKKMFHKAKIMIEFSDYRNLRDLLLSIFEYEKKFKHQILEEPEKPIKSNLIQFRELLERHNGDVASVLNAYTIEELREIFGEVIVSELFDIDETTKVL